MSKKTRKKSPKAAPQKPASGKVARAQSVKSAKTQRTKSRPAKASESTKSATKKTGGAPASQKAPAKALEPSGPTAAPKAPAPKTAATKAAAAKAPVSKTPAAKAPAAPKTAAVRAEAAVPAASKAPEQTITTPAAGKSGLVEGTKAPAFHLPRDGGGTVSLSDYAGKKLVLFFYPRADTPGCTKEAIDFSRLSGAFAESGTAVLGVSADPPKAQEAFRDKHELATPLASDEQHEMLEAYGVWGEKSMYGKTFQGILRTTVLLGEDGRILRVWRNVRVDGHADEVLAAARAL